MTRETLALARSTERWWDRAACRGVDTDLFFPTRTPGPRGRDSLSQALAAKGFCRVCPVIEECLRFAVDTGQVGIWGGMDDDERRVLRRQLGMHRGAA